MTVLTFFDNIWYHNVVVCLVLFFLVVAICFAAHFSCCDRFDRPVFLGSFNLFSFFVVCLLYGLFCFDFNPSDTLYFFNQNIQLLFITVIICVLCASRDFLGAKKVFKYEYDLLFLFIVLSGVCLCFCDEMLLIYIAIELQSLTLYVFATFNRNSEFSTESGLKYFVFGGVMSCFLILGMSTVYMFFGSLSFEVISSIISYGLGPQFFSGFTLILAVLLFKVGASPLHFWLCDVYEGSILPVTLLFASAPKIVLFGILLKLCFFVLSGCSSIWSAMIGLSAVLSIIVGSLSAIYQKRLKRLFAYSTIAHTGFILLAFLSCSLGAAKSLTFYIIVYSTLTIATFSILINTAAAMTNSPKYMINFSGIGYKSHIFAATFGLIILAVAGVPPLAGFFSKLFILTSTIGSEYYFTAAVVILFSSISCYYYIRLIKVLFFVKGQKNNLWVTNNSLKNTEVLLGSFLIFIVCYFLHPNLGVDFSVVVGLTMF